MTGGGGSDGPARPGQQPRPPLPKRFYKAVSVAPWDGPPAAGGEGRAPHFRVLLDGRPMRTPAKGVLAVPSQALAEAIAAEWEAQGERIDPIGMPLTRIANSAIDGVRGREAEVRADIAKYAASDLVCYRADAPAALARLQAEAWDGILAWARDALGARLQVGTGIMPVAQPAAALARIATALEGFDAFALAALHVATTLTGSAVLALAVARGHAAAAAAWAAAHVDEDFQISQWGEDAEAMARRDRRWREMEAASRVLTLLQP